MFRPLAFSFISMTCAWIILSVHRNFFTHHQWRNMHFAVSLCSYNIYNLMESCKPWPLSCSYWLNGWRLSVHKNWTWLFESCQSGGRESGWGVLLWNWSSSSCRFVCLVSLTRKLSSGGSYTEQKSFFSKSYWICLHMQRKWNSCFSVSHETRVIQADVLSTCLRLIKVMVHPKVFEVN